MIGHTVKSFDGELRKIYKMLNSMEMLCFKSIDVINDMINNPGQNNDNFIINHDHKINDLESKIEESIINSIALRQPMGIDLRYLVSGLKVAYALERIGDQAKNAVKRLGLVNYQISKETLRDLNKMLLISKKMIDNALNAFDSSDLKKAKEVMKEDNEINEIYYNLFISMQKIMVKEPKSIPSLVNVSFVIKSLERIADYATNIAEVVYYVAKGSSAIED